MHETTRNKGEGSGGPVQVSAPKTRTSQKKCGWRVQAYLLRQITASKNLRHQRCHCSTISIVDLLMLSTLLMFPTVSGIPSLTNHSSHHSVCRGIPISFGFDPVPPALLSYADSWRKNQPAVPRTNRDGCGRGIVDDIVLEKSDYR